MKTLSQVWESFVSLIQELSSRLRVQQMTARVNSVHEQLRSRVDETIHSVRRAMIRRSLEFATYLQMLEANSIAHAAASKLGTQAPLLHAPLPPPTFPDPRRKIGSWRSPPPRVSLNALPLRRPVEVKELSEDDFDTAPTSIYHPIPQAPGSSPTNHY